MSCGHRLRPISGLGNIEQAAPIARQIAAVLKRHGAASFRFGPCYAGGDAGKIYVGHHVSRLGDLWPGAASARGGCRVPKPFSEALKIGEMLDRSIILAEEL
jgi:hypothetical protein